jgi:hypothetical protein
MFYNLLINTNHSDFDNFMSNNILTSNPVSDLLKKSKLIYCNNNHSRFIFYTNEDFSLKKTQELVTDLFVLANGVLSNLNVLNVNITLADIIDKLEDIEYIESLFQIYL